MRPVYYIPFVSVVMGLMGANVGCGDSSATDDGGGGNGGAGNTTGNSSGGGPVDDVIEISVESANTGQSGEIDVTVSIDQGQRSFMVVGATDTNARLALLSIDDPNGVRVLRWQDWYNGVNGLTNAFFANRTATVVNWPVRAEDPALIPGDYVVRLGSYQVDGITSRPDIPVEVTTLISNDVDLDSGVVRVVVVWADGLAEDPALVAATEAAVEHWREVWAGAGLALELRYVESTIDPALPYPSVQSGDLFREASALAEDGEITLIIGETINDDPSQYGVAGQLPGPLVSSQLSAIVVGWLANAGNDGVFSENDITLYGEVLAHEVGHYMGLFHPVESSYEYWDALGDTPECSTANQCETALGTNLMFPYSICDAGTCVSTTVITDDQRGVMQRYTGTR